MNTLNPTARVLKIMQLTIKAVEYLGDVRDASKECHQYATEATGFNSLLIKLLSRLDQATSEDPTYVELRALTKDNGPFDQYQKALQQLLPKVGQQSRLDRLQRSLLWKFNKKEVVNIMERMERLKGAVSFALQMDQMYVS